MCIETSGVKRRFCADLSFPCLNCQDEVVKIGYLCYNLWSSTSLLGISVASCFKSWKLLMFTRIARWSWLGNIPDSHEYAQEGLKQVVFWFLVAALRNCAGMNLKVRRYACKISMTVLNECSSKQLFAIYELELTNSSIRNFQYKHLLVRFSTRIISLQVTDSFMRNCDLFLGSQRPLEGYCI